MRAVERPVTSANGPNAKYSAPLTIEPEQVKGFGLWVLRAVMNGRGDEVIDLAKTNMLPR
jgi:hypothetical protein